MESKRRTGRTTRMLEEAQRLEAAGQDVYVVAAHVQHLRELRLRLPPNTRIRVIVSDPGTFDWETETLRGMRGAVLVDHYTRECRAQQLENLNSDIRANREREEFMQRLPIAPADCPVISPHRGKP